MVYRLARGTPMLSPAIVLRPSRYFTISMNWQNEGTSHPMHACLSISDSGDKEKTLDGLEKCYEDQDGACWWLRVDQVYDGIREESRFQAILKKIGLE